ncbi:MAG: DUF1573 domain-containing protein [Pirellulales bacterium]|nr:DUF1573 domain-containing protein [Pirellulales bacterium]
MQRHFLTLAIIAAIFSHDVQAQEWARKMFAEKDGEISTSHDFGYVARGSKVEHRFKITNRYKEDVHISGVSASCRCATPTLTKTTLKTWEKGELVVTYNTHLFLGHRSATITVNIDKPFPATVYLQVSGYIRSDVVLEPHGVDFGSVDQGSKVSKKVRVKYAGRSDWKITDVRSTNPNYEVEVKEISRAGGEVIYDLIVDLGEKNKAGYLNDILTVVTNDSRATKFPVDVRGNVVAALTVSPGELFIGDVKPGSEVTKKLVVRGKKPFKITKIGCNDDCFTFDSGDEAKKLHVIPVTFKAPAETGDVRETISIETDLDGASQSIKAHARVAS